jgi:hypothetical protein
MFIYIVEFSVRRTVLHQGVVSALHTIKACWESISVSSSPQRRALLLVSNNIQNVD